MAALTVWKRDREGSIKFAVNEADHAAFTAATTGRLYLHVPHVRPGVMDASVWRLDADGVVLRLDGPAVAPPPLSAIRPERQVHLSGSWVWTWESPSTVAAR
jgi:hypothetical protein